MVGGPAANSYFLPGSVDASTETERTLYRLSLPESTATGVQRLLRGSRSRTGVDSSWMLSKSPVSQPCRAHVKVCCRRTKDWAVPDWLFCKLFEIY